MRERSRPAGARGPNEASGPVALALAFSVLAAGCSYTSKYVAPADGRARAVWKGNQVELEVASYAGPACGAAIAALAGGKAPRAFGLAGPRARGAPPYWVPRYYGPPLVVVTPGLAPRPPLPPLFLPRPIIHHHAAAAGPHLGHASTSTGGGGGSDLGKAAVYLAVVLLVALPALDVGLALSNPENGRASQRAINQVNAYNDLTRQPGTPCAPMVEAP